MDFRLSPEQEAIRQEARQFAREVLRPGASRRERTGEFPEEAVQEAARRGYLGLLVPEGWGGRGVGNVAQCLVLEELARVDASTHVTISVHNSLVTLPVMEYGTEALRSHCLPRLARGEWIGAYALTEPHSGSDAAALSTTAVRDGDSWVLNGSKMWITTGSRADLMIVFARTDPEAPKAKGISAFAVETATRGLITGKKENKLGLRASETVQVFFEDLRVPAENLLGEPDEGFAYAMQYLDGGRVGIGTQAVGIAQAALDVSVAHLRERRRGGESVRPTQDEDFRLAEMATAVEAARLLVWRAAACRDRGEPGTREASMAKLLASSMANEVCRKAVDLLGPRGWKAGGEVERFLRDARVAELYEGTTEIQKLVISRNLRA